MAKTISNSSLNWVKKLKQDLQTNPQLTSIKLIWIESRRFIDRENPAIDIYDQMLEQNCHPFEHGLPENLAKLRLYWHLLQRNALDNPLILLFYDDAPEPQSSYLSPNLLETLGKFQGIIGVISHQTLPDIPLFSPEDPQLVSRLLGWMVEQVEGSLQNPDKM